MTTLEAQQEVITNLILENKKLKQEQDELRNKLSDALGEIDLRTLDIIRLKDTIVETLEKNRHLADGKDCTLAKLKQVVPDWK